MGIKITDHGIFNDLKKNAGLNKNTHAEIGIMMPDIATIGMYLEYGWDQRVTAKQNVYLSSVLGLPIKDKEGNWIQNFAILHLPPRPFMRATFAEKNKEWKKIFESQFKKTHDVKSALEAMCIMASSDISATIRNNGTASNPFPKRSPLTMAMLDAMGETEKAKRQQKGQAAVSNTTTDKALMRTGVLEKSITYKIHS